MTDPGRMRERVRFERRGDIENDGHGTVIGDFEPMFGSVAAKITPRLGGETVISSRLQGVQPFTVTVRSSSDTRCVDATCRCVNERTGAIYDIRAISNPDQKNKFLDMLVEAKQDSGG